MNSNSKWAMIVIAFLAFGSYCFGQSSTKKVKVYNAIVETVVEGRKYRGALFEVKDSSVIILLKRERLRIPSNAIKSIKIKRKSAVGRGVAIGGLTGLAVGFIIGIASGDDECSPTSFCIMSFSAEEKAVGGGLALSATGIILGAIIGSVSRKENVKVNGDQEIFESNQDVLRKYTQTVP